MFSRRDDRHYDAAQWVDFVRGLTKQTDREAMQAHLETGCEKCRQIAQLFAQVQKRAGADAKYQVPDYAVRSARALYTLQQPEEVSLLPRTIAKLVYDSFREPLLAGVRSRQVSMVHQLMYTAGAYCVDLRLEQERGAPHISMVGQIVNREHSATGVANVRVFLFSRSSVLAQDTSNDFGEFAMEYRPTNSLRLYAPVPDQDHAIEVRLGRLVASGDQGRKRSRAG